MRISVLVILLLTLALGIFYLFTDIDECQQNSTLCVQACTNYPGTYNCSCQPGYEGDGRSNGTGCKPVPKSERFPLINRIALGEKLSLLPHHRLHEIGIFILQQ